MLIGAVEVYANHAFVILGPVDRPELDDWDTSLPASADTRHVAIKTRGQIDHTRVSLWSGAMPMFGEAIFDDDLDLHDAKICVSDIEYTGQWIKRIQQSGPQRVIVRVDDPGHASLVHVGLDLGPDPYVRSLPSAGGPHLFDVLVAREHDMSLPNERGLALDGHDSPHARLTAAILLLSRPDPSAPWRESYEANLIAEWLRWLAIGLDFAAAKPLGQQVQDLVRTRRPDPNTALSSQDASEIAKTILDAIAYT
ncbi:hypothetical protein GCM10009557_26300 [Virgisporangium ochraceum]|uniref:Uncharacterized protein n=1 Tax=Virgisporangium ochraceum TaxID=65505 RepID=A0A8J4EI89_9ACTN|nr:hypothetical protein [Virgisporangium ochraceum]GIJ75476.1 hypothetical protein Voc01_103930 [Virgisporangium ochraceum]